MFIPTTEIELKKNHINQLDIIIISGDTYIDSSYNGAAIIGKLLMSKGYSVGIIAQPTLKDSSDILRLGTPKLYWAVTAGAMDSMVANFTALKKRRRSDDLTPGGENNRRPDRAIIAYTNLIKQHAKDAKPIVLGGIEASLRRFAHFDYWQEKIRQSVLVDSKADFLVYGMGEKAIVELSEAIKERKSYKRIKGICYIDKSAPSNAILLPSFQEVSQDSSKFEAAFHLFYNNQDAYTAKPLAQEQNSRFVIHTPPATPASTEELDAIYGLDFENDAHPYYKSQGKITALDTTQFSITTHRGCYGECNFCAIALHQGKHISSRSENSIIEEAQKFTTHPQFKGVISDVGGPTANMYGFECSKRTTHGSCLPNNQSLNRCLFTKPCKSLPINHLKQIKLLNSLREIKKIKHIFIASGIRYDLILADKTYGKQYLEAIVKNHLSGQMKIAPEHTESDVLRLMGKPESNILDDFITLFTKTKKTLNTKSFLTYYFIAAHPGSTLQHMENLNSYAKDNLRISPEQTQVFTPTPSTYSTLMYYTKRNPFTKEPIFVETGLSEKKFQKMAITK